MKRTILALFVCACIAALAQLPKPGAGGGGGGAGSASIASGTSLPGSCAIGDAYIRTDFSLRNLFFCTALNVWQMANGDYCPPTSWTWENQVSATITSGTCVEWLVNDATNNGMHIRHVSSGAAPWRVRARLIKRWRNTTSDERFGLVARESGTGRLIVFTFGHNTSNSPYMAFSKYTNATTLSADYSGSPSTSNAFLYPWTFRPDAWVSLEDDNTNLKAYYSEDGVNWTQFDSRSRTDFLTGGADQIGFFTGAAANVTDGVGLVSWRVTSN